MYTIGTRNSPEAMAQAAVNRACGKGCEPVIPLRTGPHVFQQRYCRGRRSQILTRQARTVRQLRAGSSDSCLFEKCIAVIQTGVERPRPSSYQAYFPEQHLGMEVLTRLINDLYRLPKRCGPDRCELR